MIKLDDLACSADVGRINPETSRVIEPTHACPSITNNYIPLEHNTVSIEQCLTRISINAKCTKTCTYAIKLKKKIK